MLSYIKRLLGFDTAVVPDAVTTSPDTLNVSKPSVATMIPTIAVVNVSSIITDAEIAATVQALQIQVTRDFAPVWKTSAKLVAIPKDRQPSPDAWVIYVMDTSDQAGALGYHDLTPAGNPVGKIFAMDDKKYGLSWTVTLSHELLEILADPFIQNTVFSQQTNTTGTIYALEVCDAIEADQFGYKINGVLVSDFVFPAWFENWRQPNSTQFDYMKVLKAPLTLAPGGYIGCFTVPTTTGWQQLTAETVPPARLISKGEYSRTKRRKR